MKHHASVVAPIWAALCLACALLWMLGAKPVAAHGEDGVARLTNFPLGLYHLSVWTSPGILRPGKTHIETVVTAPNGAISPDCAIEITITPLGHDAPVQSAPAVGNGSDADMRCEATFDLNEVGLYTVVLKVTTPSGRIVKASFDMALTPVGRWISGTIYGLLLFTGTAAGWLSWLGIRLYWGIRKPRGQNAYTICRVKRYEYAQT